VLEEVQRALLQSIVDPFQSSTATDADGHIYYGSDDGKHWILYAYTGATTGDYMWRTDSSSTINEGVFGDITIP